MRFAFIAAWCVLVLAACQLGDGSAGLRSSNEADAGTDQPPGEADASIDPPRVTAGRLLKPAHGDLVEGSTDTVELAVEGDYTQPGAQIRVQLLADPAQLDSWETVEVATADQQSTGGMYLWRTSIAPGATRWPSGGVLRVRALDADGVVLSGRFHDSFDAYTNPLGVVIANPATPPADIPYLDRRGTGSADETLEYYAAIDAPATLDEFRTRYNTDSADAAAATFYNAGDLAVGRAMRCAPFVDQGLRGVACEVGNFGEFGGDQALGLAEAVVGDNRFATVAMVYRPPITAPNAVQFIAYNAAGTLLSEAQLDTRGDNVSIPQNCINCHGSAATYDPATNAVTGARFLPFDPNAFVFAADPGFTFADQEASIRRLNELMLQTEPTPATRELIGGFYQTETTDASFVPLPWRGTRETEHVYREVVAHSCRTCHVSRDDSYSFRSAADFLGAATAISSSLCGPDRDMPNAEAVLKRFWSGRGRAYAVGFLDIAGSCAP